MGLSLALLIALAAVGAEGRLGRNRAASSASEWPPANQIYSDPAKPPAWMQPPPLANGLAVPRTAPAPVAPSALLPTDPFILNAAYWDELAIQQPPPSGSSKGNGAVWPPSPPTEAQQRQLNLAALLPYRPLTLLDAKPGEYATNNAAAGKPADKK